jgi:hypothetical protein
MRMCVSVFAVAAFTMTLSADTSKLLKFGTDYTPKNGRFTITLPEGEMTGDKVMVVPLMGGGPRRFAKGGGKGGRLTAPVEISASEVADGTTFVGASVGIPQAVLKEIAEEKRMGLYRDLFVTSKKGKIASEKDIKQGDWPGKEYMVELPETRMRMQLYVLDGYGFYAMVEGDTDDRLKAKDVDRFFASFKLKAKE